MAGPCDSVLISQILTLATTVKKRIAELFTGHGRILAKAMKDVWQEVSTNALGGVKTWLAPELRDTLIEGMVGVISIALKTAVSLDFRTAKSRMEQYLSSVGNSANQLAVLIMGVPNFDLFILRDSIIDARKYLFLYMELISEIHSKLLEIKTYLPDDKRSKDWTDTIFNFYLKRWIQLLKAAEASLRSAEDLFIENKPVFPNIKRARASTDTVVNQMIANIPDQYKNLPEFVKHSNLYKAINAIIELSKLVLGEEREQINLTRPLTFKVPKFIDYYEQLVFWLDGITAFGDLTKPAKDRFGLGRQFDKFAMMVGLVIADFISNVIEQMEKVSKSSRFALVAYYYQWLVTLMACNEGLRQLLGPLSEITEFASQRQRLNALLEQLRAEESKLAKNEITSKFLELTSRITLLEGLDRIIEAIDDALTVLSREISTVSRINSLLNQLEENLPQSTEFVEAAMSAAREIAEKFGIPTDKFNVRAIQNIYSDLRIAAMISAQLVALVKCLEERISKAKSIEEAEKARNVLNVARSVSSPGQYSQQQVFSQQLQALKTQLQVLQEQALSIVKQ